MDADGNGYLDYQDVMGRYDASKHPAVIDGRRTERDILNEFLATFEQHKSQNPDGIVTPEEFSEYYANVSASIDDDAYFAQMMNSSWNLDGAAASYASYGKGWSGKSEAAPKANKKNGQGYSPTKSRHVDSKLRSGMESTENPFTASKQYYEAEASRSTGKRLGYANPTKAADYKFHEQSGQESVATTFSSTAGPKYTRHIEQHQREQQFPEAAAAAS